MIGLAASKHRPTTLFDREPAVRLDPLTTAAVNRFVIATPIIAVLYNALLAALAVMGAPVNVNTAIGFEIAVIVTALATSFAAGTRRGDALPLCYIYFSLLMAAVMTLLQAKVAVDGLRNALIVGGFTLLGARASERTVRIVFSACAAITLIVLVWEIWALESYAATFRPADYLSKTRGYSVKEFYADVGLSIGTMGYSSRFSFGLFSGPRTSSIFLEQVGINCYAIVVMVYLVTMWPRLTRWERALNGATSVLIILSNNARMSAIVLPIMLAGYFIFPRLPRYANVVLPAALLGAMAVLFQFQEARIGDTLMGRLAVTYHYLQRLTAADLLIGNMTIARRAFDTGYGFVLVSTTIFGAFAYWAYLTLVVPQKSVTARRAAWSMNTYIYLWLMVGGTASFSMKTATLLWFLMGYLRVTHINLADRPRSATRHRSPRPKVSAAPTSAGSA